MAEGDKRQLKVVNDILLFLKKDSIEHPNLNDSLDVAINVLQDHFKIYPDYVKATRNRDIISLADAVIQEAENVGLGVPGHIPAEQGDAAAEERDAAAVERDAAAVERDAAAAELRQAAAKEREAEAEKYNSMGNKLSSEKRYTEALQKYSQAINLCPRDPVFYHNRAAALYFLEKYALCINDCRKALKLDSSYAKVYGRIGMAAYQLNNFGMAKRMFKRALILQPLNNAFKNQLKMVSEKLIPPASAEPAKLDCKDKHAGASVRKDVDLDNNPKSIQKSGVDRAHGGDQTDQGDGSSF